MNDEEKLAKVLELAAQTGRLYVAADVHRAVHDAVAAGTFDVRKLDGIVLTVSAHLEPGTVLAVDVDRFRIPLLQETFQP